MKTRKKLGEMLVDAGLLTNDQLQQALAGQRGSGLKLGQYLVREGVIREDQVIDQISQHRKIAKYDRPDPG